MIFKIVLEVREGSGLKRHQSESFEAVTAVEMVTKSEVALLDAIKSFAITQRQTSSDSKKETDETPDSISR